MTKLNQHYSRLKRRLRLRFVTGTWAFIHALLQYPHAWRLLMSWQHWRSCEGSFPTACAAWEATVDLVASRVWVRPAFQLDNHCHLLNVIAQLFTGCICLFCLRLPNRWSCFSFNFMLFMYPGSNNSGICFLSGVIIGFSGILVKRILELQVDSKVCIQR